MAFISLQIIQWRGDPGSNNSYSSIIGEYKPNYTGNEKITGIVEWNRHVLKWFTADGTRPTDRAKDCSILSAFAEALSLECEHAISLAFVVGFGTLFVILLLIFIIVKRR